MGEVYRAKDPRLGREVAIKVLPASFSQDADRLRRFEQEAKAAGVLNHPNITAVYDIGVARRRALRRPGAARGRDAALGARRRKALAAQDDRVRDPDLARPRRRARKGDRPPRPEAREPLRHEGRARQDPRLRPRQAHAGRRGLRPADEPPHGDGRHRARRRHGHARLHVARAGTRPARGRAHATSSPSGRSSTRCSPATAPSTATRPADTMSAILKEDPPDLSVTNQAISPGLERIVRHCLEKNPEQRFHSAHDLAFDLEALSGTSAQTAVQSVGSAPRPPLGPARPRRRSRRRRRVRRRPLPLESAKPSRIRASSGSRSGAATSATRALPRTARASSTARPGKDKPIEIYTVRPGSPETTPLGYKNAALFGVSSTGELALSLRDSFLSGSSGIGTLAKAPLGGGVPREIVEVRRVGRLGARRQGARDHPVRRVQQPPRVPDRQGPLQEPAGRSLRRAFSPRGDRIAFLERAPGGATALGDGPGRERPSSAPSVCAASRSRGRPRATRSGSEDRSGQGDDRIVAVAPSGKTRVLARAPGRLIPYDIAPDGRVLLEHAIGRRSVVGLAPGESKQRDLSWFDGTNPIGISADGTTALLLETGDAGGVADALLPAQDRRLAGRQARRGQRAGSFARREVGPRARGRREPASPSFPPVPATP